MIGKDRQNVLTSPGWPQWRTAYHFTMLVWKMPPSWHWTDHSGATHWNTVSWWQWWQPFGALKLLV